MSEQDIIDLIEKDKWMMDVLRAAESLNLPDWWIGAGFIRSKVWDHLHKYKKRTQLPDIDLIYFDKSDFTEDEAEAFSTKSEDRYQRKLAKFGLGIKWSVTNQARMHLFHKTKPYKDSAGGLSEWAETATCVGVRLKSGKLTLVAPHGVKDLTKGILRPTFKMEQGLQTFRKRVKEKRWLEKWPKLKLVS